MACRWRLVRRLQLQHRLPVHIRTAADKQHLRGVLAYRIREGHFGDVTLTYLRLVLVATFEGNIWAGQATGFKAGLFLDSAADPQQQEALQMIFSGQAGGVPALLSAIWGPPELVGMEVVPIDFEVAGDLAFWRAEVPGKVVARADALSGPTTPPGHRVQLAPGR